LNLPTPQEFINILLKCANPDENLDALADLMSNTVKNCFKGKKIRLKNPRI
jgi:hypothetical protein